MARSTLISAILAVALLAACTLPMPPDLDAEFRNNPAAAQQFRENTRKMAEQMSAQVAGSFRSRTCGAAALPNDDARIQLRSLLQDQLSNFARNVGSSDLPSIFTSQSIGNSEIGAGPISDQAKSFVRNAEIDVSSDRTPQASARGSRVIVSLALVRALCRETDSEPGMLLIRSAMLPPEPDDFFGPAMVHFSQIGDLMQAWLMIAQTERSFDNALFFVLGHEISHLMFDPSSSAAVTGVMREVRADLFGLFIGEAMTGRYRLQADQRIQLARTGRWRETNKDDIITMMSTEGHRTVFELVYIKANLVEPGGVHLAYEDRLRFLNSIGEELAMPVRR